MDIYVLFGQTATGKTAKAIELAKKIPPAGGGELVNFDSRQIYKKLDIVTGKDIPINAELKKSNLKLRGNAIEYYNIKNDVRCTLHVTRLWLYNIVDPKCPFSSADYCDCAKQVIEDIISRGKTPILVGGTGYYLHHLLCGVPETGVKENWDIRNKLNDKSVEELQSILKEKNKGMLEEMNNSDRNNPRRLIRRIEILENGGSLPPISSHIPKLETETLSARLRNRSAWPAGRQGCQRGIPFTYFPFFHRSADVAREKITRRVEERIENGAIEEVKELLSEGYTVQDPGLNAIGYKQLISYIKGEKTLNEAKAEWVTKEVQYAKRQKTYFKKYFSQPPSF